jgi:hypothetical protein
MKQKITMHLPESLGEMMQELGSQEVYRLALISYKIEIMARARRELAQRQLGRAIKKLGPKKLKQLARAVRASKQKGGKK